jgi:hypothetical protein
MKLPRRRFRHLAAGAAARPIMSRITTLSGRTRPCVLRGSGMVARGIGRSDFMMTTASKQWTMAIVDLIKAAMWPIIALLINYPILRTYTPHIGVFGSAFG